MKAMTVTQPWATLIASGAKRIETRSWRTRYRGPLAIHAAASFPRYALRACFDEQIASALGRSNVRALSDLPRGAVVAIAQLVDCRRVDELPGRLLTSRELRFGDYTPGRYGWVLDDVRLLRRPVPARGALGLWEWTQP